jgi:hypothetical protein
MELAAAITRARWRHGRRWSASVKSKS